MTPQEKLDMLEDTLKAGIYVNGKLSRNPKTSDYFRRLYTEKKLELKTMLDLLKDEELLKQQHDYYHDEKRELTKKAREETIKAKKENYELWKIKKELSKKGFSCIF